jgi:nitrile hydratase
VSGNHGGGHLGDGHDGHPAAVRVRRFEEQVIAAGLITDAELDEILLTDWPGSPADGAAIVARAWSDPAYLELLLADGNAAVAAAGSRPATITG